MENKSGISKENITENKSRGGAPVPASRRDWILRGLRDASDFEAEIKVAQGLKVLDPQLETVFLGTDIHYCYLSSSMVREVASGGGDVSAYVPEGFAPLVAEKYKNR